MTDNCSKKPQEVQMENSDFQLHTLGSNWKSYITPLSPAFIAVSAEFNEAVPF